MSCVAERDWYDWHAPYDDPESGLSRRLSWVQDRIRVALDEAPPGPFRAISLCAGQGRDLIGVLSGHPRRGDVTAYGQCCGAHRFTGVPAPLEEGASMFEFTGHDLRGGPARR